MPAALGVKPCLTCESVPKQHYVSVDGESPLSGCGAPVSLCRAALGRTIGQRGQDAAPQSQPPPPNPAMLNGSIVTADLLSSSCTLSFFSFSQYIMTPDYVTTGIVSDWPDHIEIKDEDLIQRQLQVFFWCMVSLGPAILKVCGFTFVHLLYVCFLNVY